MTRMLLAVALLGLVGCRSQTPTAMFEPEANRFAADGAENPAVLVETSGKAYALAIEGKMLGLYRSDDGGDSFAKRIAITRSEEPIDRQSEVSPLLLGHHAMTYYVLWLARGELRLSKSVDYGETFSEPATMLREVAYFNAAVGPGGELVVVWFRYDGGGHVHGTASLNVASSRDGGKTFGEPVRITADVCPCCRPAILAQGGRWYAAWRGVGADDVRDVSVAQSSDRGATWTAAATVSEDGWKVRGCPHSAPSLAAFGGKLFVSWSTGADGDYEGYFASSPLETLAFSKRTALITEARDVNHARLVVAGDRLLAVFQARDTKERGGFGKSRAYLREVAPNASARPVAAPRSPGSVSYPVAAAYPPGAALLAWTALTETGPTTHYTRARLP